MSIQLLYLIGSPGSGKSTLFAELLKGLECRIGLRSSDNPVPPHVVYPGHAVQLGAVRESFSGTDAMAMNVQPSVLKWLMPMNYFYSGLPVIAEGDRLANAAFFNQVVANGVNLSVLLMDCPEEEAVRRRAARGSNQNPSWLKGRVTKVQRLSDSFVLPKNRLDATLPVAELALQVKQHPFLSKKFSIL